MDYWEFLLQRDGDSSWLPLEVAQVEILEGRYRIMAHTSRLGQQVEVRIHQLILDRHPPKRRTLKRQAQVSDSGLLVVMPFTWLTAGRWEIGCSQSDASPGWHYGVQLQVQPQDGDTDDWFPEPAPTAAPRPVPVAADASVAPPLPALPPEDLAQIFALAPGTVDSLALDRSAWVGSKGQTLTLTGQVPPTQPGTAPSAVADAPPQGYLVAQLVDPQTGLPVWAGQQVVAADASFALALTLPAALDTRLLLGELRLVVPRASAGHGAASEAGFTLLATGRFTVTVDLADLFDRMANQGETQPDLGVIFPADPLGAVGAEADSPDSDGNPTAAQPPLDLPHPAPRAIPVVTLPTDGKGLPPQLYYSRESASIREPVLPPLAPPSVPPLATQPTPPPTSPDSGDPPSPVPASPVPDPAVPDPDPETALEGATPESTPEATATPEATGPKPVPTGAGSGSVQLPSFVQPQRSAERSSSEPSSEPSSDPPPTPVPLLMDSTTSAFRSLNLESRFWQRLNTLAVELQQSQPVPAPVTPPPAGEEGGDRPEHGEQSDDSAAAPEAVTTFPGEVVIYEDELPPAAPLPDSTDLVTEAPPPAPPELVVPTGELVAGEGIGLQIRVPMHPNRMYVKVWMVDPQTRSLADAPRQLMNLVLDGEGYLGSPLQLTVPQGCLELWFEAVAVDMLTQQESYKTTVVRSVRPAELPPADLPEFDL